RFPISASTCCTPPMDWPTTSDCESSIVWRIFSPPGTSPTPVCPALSSRITTLRVKKGPCAPLRFSSMLSCPATGTTRRLFTTGAPRAATSRFIAGSVLKSAQRQRQPHLEAAALAGPGAGSAHDTAVALDELAHQGEADAQAAFGPHRDFLRLREEPEKPR